MAYMGGEGRPADRKGLRITVRGTVISGVGRGRNFVSLPWFIKYVKEMLRFEPFPGTLNIVVADGEAERIAKILDKHGGLMVTPRDGHYPGNLYRALIASRIEGAVVRPRVQGYPKNLLEIIAPVCLREALGLRDGDEVSVEVFIE